jgi:N-methylhydantoinase B
MPAPTCRSVLYRASGEVEELEAKKIITIRAGDVLRMWMTGGGGYGSPLDRDAAPVLDDVLDGRVSREAARDVYGVVIEGQTVNDAATRARREALRREVRAAVQRAAEESGFATHDTGARD